MAELERPIESSELTHGVIVRLVICVIVLPVCAISLPLTNNWSMEDMFIGTLGFFHSKGFGILLAGLVTGITWASVYYGNNKGMMVYTEEGLRQREMKKFDDHQKRLLSMEVGAYIEWGGWEVTRVPGGWMFKDPMRTKSSPTFVSYTTNTNNIP